MSKFEEYLEQNRKYLDSLGSEGKIRLDVSENVRYMIRTAYCEGYNQGKVDALDKYIAKFDGLREKLKDENKPDQETT